MKHVTCITINTDASFCPETGASGYAFYAICDNFKIMKSGNFKKKPTVSWEAELFCLGNAIHTVLSQTDLPESKHIVINTDCDSMIGMLNRPQDKIKQKWGVPVKQVHMLAGRLKNVCKTPKKNLKYRHVKAHTSIKDARTWVNNWCDKEAKKWMNREREQFRNK